MKNFLILTVFVLSHSLCFAQENLQKVRITDFSGGMVSNSLADLLQPNQSASMLNVELSQPGKLKKRKGQSLFNRDVGSTAFKGIGRFDPDANTSYLVAASGVNIIRSLSSSVDWTIANPTSPLTTGLNTEFIQANDLLFVLNGYDNTSWYNGSNWIAGGSWPTSPPSATTGAWLRNYLFLAGATTENDWVYVSNNLAPTTFGATDIIKINTGDGQKIQRLEAFRLNEVIAYKERSTFVLDITGSPPSTCTTDCWTVQPISTVIGTIAPRSVVNLGNDQWFLSSEPIAVRSLARTQFDKILVNMVSAPIQDIFDGTGSYAINKTYISKAAAVLFDNKYLLAIPVGTSSVNNLVAAYDFETNSWSLITGWYPEAWVTFDNKLYYIDANDGRVLECFANNYADFAVGPNSASMPSVGIDLDYISRNLDFDNTENFKNLDSIEVEFDPTGTYEAVVYTNLDGRGWTSIGSVSLAATSLTLPFTLPSPFGDAGLARKTFPLSSKGDFKKLQVRVKQNAASEQTVFQRATIFASPRKWRRD